MNGPEIGSNREDMPSAQEQLAELEQRIADLKAQIKVIPPKEQFKDLQNELATAEEAKKVLEQQIAGEFDPN